MIIRGTTVLTTFSRVFWKHVDHTPTVELNPESARNMYRKLIHVFILSSLHLIKHAFQETTSTYDVIFKRNERVDIEVLHMINPRNAHLLNL